MKDILKGCVDIWLEKYNSSNGWGIDWVKVPLNVDVFALALKQNNEIQGLIALKQDSDIRVLYLHWACTAPRNNIYLFGKKNIVV